jgi:hypothetical protein
MSDEQKQATETPEKTTQVVVDNKNVDAMLAEARGEKYEPKKEAEKPAEAAKVEKPAESEEDENGLTAEQKATFTENMKKTIGKKHRLQKEAEELAEEQYNTARLAEKRAEKLERDLARLQEQLTPAKVEEAKEPNRADFKDDKSYADAMIDYRVDQKLKAKEADDHKRALEDRQREGAVQATARIEEARKLVPDFDEVLASVDDDKHPVSQTIAGYMQESDMFAELGYYFAKNTEALDNIMKLSPTKQLVAIGKIESTLKPFSTKTEKAEEVKTDPASESSNGKAKADPSTNAKASKARPEPIKPIETGSTSQVEKPEGEMTYQEYKAHWQKKRGIKLGLRKHH